MATLQAAAKPRPPGSAGMSLAQYRNRVRVSRALERLAAGEESLGVLAADLGFCDQAHLTRTVRAYAGHTPAALRRLLRGSTQARRRI
jgi:AraC-like DNA-binding protein